MKLIKIIAEGLPLFKEKLEICFFAQQRVYDEDKASLNHLFGSIYANCANAFIGINASGKTSVLKVIMLSLGILNNEAINHIEGKEILGKTEKATLELVFYAKPDRVCCLKTVISHRVMNGEIHYTIVDEALWEKDAKSTQVRKTLTGFSGLEPISRRDSEEVFLPDDVSFIIARNKKEKEFVRVSSLLSMTNVNTLQFTEEISPEIVAYLDPTIEKICFDRTNEKPIIHLKFKGENEHILFSGAELEHYLSSGTIKGIATFTLAKHTLQDGGYLIVDEIENHFNREIVSTLIRFFTETELNSKGGVLIFSTHYPELLDEFDRNDAIHIIRNRNGITVENLNNILTRNDIKKSDAYQSGFLEGTTPAYEAYMKLKKSIARDI